MDAKRDRERQTERDRGCGKKGEKSLVDRRGRNAMLDFRRGGHCGRWHAFEIPPERTAGGPQGKRGGGGAFRFSKIFADFCSRGLSHLILRLKRPGRSIRP